MLEVGDRFAAKSRVRVNGSNLDLDAAIQKLHLHCVNIATAKELVLGTEQAVLYRGNAGSDDRQLLAAVALLNSLSLDLVVLIAHVRHIKFVELKQFLADAGQGALHSDVVGCDGSQFVVVLARDGCHLLLHLGDLEIVVSLLVGQLLLKSDLLVRHLLL